MIESPDEPEVVESLHRLGRRLETPTPSADLGERVLGRLADAPVPRPQGRLARTLAAVGAWASSRIALVIAAVVVVLGGLVVATPVGASVAEWFNFRGVLVERGDRVGSGPTETPQVPQVPPGLTLEEAADRVDFVPRSPQLLGEPDRVGVDRDETMVSLSWGSDEETVRLDQFDGGLAPGFRKTAADAEPVAVGRHDGLWFPTPHPVVVLGTAGEQTVPSRLAAQTLVWEQGGVTLRLEGRFSRERALAIAGSLR